MVWSTTDPRAGRNTSTSRVALLIPLLTTSRKALAFTTTSIKIFPSRTELRPPAHTAAGRISKPIHLSILTLAFADAIALAGLLVVESQG